MATRIANTLGLDAFAANYFEYDGAEQLADCLQRAPKPWLPVGGGSNLLFSKPVVEGSVFRCTDAGWEASWPPEGKTEGKTTALRRICPEFTSAVSNSRTRSEETEVPVMSGFIRGKITIMRKPRK